MERSFEKYVEAQFETLKVQNKELSHKVDLLFKADTKSQVKVARLEVKSTVWGAIGGAIASFAHHVFLGR